MIINTIIDLYIFLKKFLVRLTTAKNEKYTLSLHFFCKTSNFHPCQRHMPPSPGLQDLCRKMY